MTRYLWWRSADGSDGCYCGAITDNDYAIDWIRLRMEREALARLLISAPNNETRLTIIRGRFEWIGEYAQ
jgi:hypothetical protein